LGKIQINSLKDLTKVGSVLNKDFSEPSIFDLDDLQKVPREFMENTKTDNYITSSSSTSSLSSSESPISPSFLMGVKKNEQFEWSTNEFKYKTCDNFTDEENENDTSKYKEKNNSSKSLSHKLSSFIWEEAILIYFYSKKSTHLILMKVQKILKLTIVMDMVKYVWFIETVKWVSFKTNTVELN